MPTKDEHWNTMASQAAAFRERTGDFPRGDNDLGRWLQVQRSADRRGEPALTDLRKNTLDRLLPGWRDSASGAAPSWRDTARAVRQFRAEHGTWPSQIGRTAEEARLGRWLTTQRGMTRQGKLLAERQRWLDKQMPGWNAAGSRKDAWVRNAHALGTWRDEHDVWPSPKSSDTVERQIGRWLKNRREDARAGRLSRSRARLLDRLAAGWLDGTGRGRNGCTKQFYVTQAEAREALANIRAAHVGERKAPVRVYPCDTCDGWHTTSKPNKGRIPAWDRDPDWQRPTPVRK